MPANMREIIEISCQTSGFISNINQNLQIPQAVTGISVGNRMNHKDIGYAQNVLDVPGKTEASAWFCFELFSFGSG